ncbi:TetR/AcrR family transcriptional regulator [Sinorhizobium garamanticum]|uniref:TetR/AcrR family transcriptional regulator n=1 Tax=Sinorhizobium garamanticum TaxID=680247 RepID=A0ABY8DA94_9HYPH|nr:TetR/AcrR family transcriptional regulator [Sinorhizobium garamanticum]WEX87804.1 TetR/AcrR family transcriptional regulator [Sinorhizobium garamanticum]
MSQEHMSLPKRRGRPPSQMARARVLKAAHDILTEDGFGRLTVEAVAAKSGVGKPTIYRQWANASELAMAALMSGDTGAFDEGGTNLRSALTAQMRSLIQAFATTRGRQIAMTLAAADPDSEFTKAFRNQVILSSREAGRALLLEAAARGEIMLPQDVDVLLDMIYGPVFYRLLVGHRPLDASFADNIVAIALEVVASS